MNYDMDKSIFKINKQVVVWYCLYGQEHIENLCLTVKSKFANAKIGVSGITLREDVQVNNKIQEVNNGIKEMCKKRNYTFIDNSNIKSNSLNRSKLHLNTRGSALLASGLIKFLRGEDHLDHLDLANTMLEIFDQRRLCARCRS